MSIKSAPFGRKGALSYKRRTEALPLRFHRMEDRMKKKEYLLQVLS
jgi:hypothetical protein